MAILKTVTVEKITQNVHALDHHYLDLKFTNIDTVFDTHYSALWCTLKSSKTPFLSISLLNDIRTLQDTVAQHCSEQPKLKPKFIIWQSDLPDIFNLGLDLDHIYQLILDKNEKGLEHYIQLCIDAYYINLIRLDIQPLITISLVRGKAYGGGLDAALASDIVIAEENSKCRFPEISFHLLPSIGTLAMMLRQYPINVVEELIFEGKNLNLDKLKQMNLIHSTIEDGTGINYIQSKLKHLHKRHNIYATMYKSKKNSIAVNHQELAEFRDMWIQTALAFKPDNLRKLERYVTAQKNLLRALKARR